MDDKHTVVSRRDFLKRAGKEAVDTGTSLVPGMGAAKAALKKAGEAVEAPTEAGVPVPAWKRVLRRFARPQGDA